VKILALFLSLFNLSIGLAAVKMELVFKEQQVKQGQITQALVRADLEVLQKIDLTKFKGQTVGDQLYFVNLTPPVRRSGERIFEAAADVVFIKIPHSTRLEAKLADRDIHLTWSSLQVLPTQSGNDFIFSDWSLPRRLPWGLWSLIALLLAIGGGFVFFRLRKKHLQRKRERAKKLKLIEILFNSTQVEEIIEVWKMRSELLTEFPLLMDDFKQFENVLYLYQFKPMMSDHEKSLVVQAYKKFLLSAEGAFRGV
jgi:hypothetical protein